MNQFTSWVKLLLDSKTLSNAGNYKGACACLSDLARSVINEYTRIKPQQHVTSGHTPRELGDKILSNLGSTNPSDITSDHMDELRAIATKMIDEISKESFFIQRNTPQNSKSNINKHLLGIAAALCTILIPVALSVAGYKYYFSDSNKIKRTNETLNELSVLLTNAKITSKKHISELSGNTCSECPCRERGPISLLAGNDVCRENWYQILRSAYTVVSKDGPTSGLDNLSPIDSRLFYDDWGSPFLMDENAGELPNSNNKNDVLRSAGPDGLLHTDDDIVVTLPRVFSNK